MKTFHGKAECPDHGVFEWKGYKLGQFEVSTFKWDDTRKNFGGLSSNDKEAIAICPNCGKRIMSDIIMD